MVHLYACAQTGLSCSPEHMQVACVWTVWLLVWTLREGAYVLRPYAASVTKNHTHKEGLVGGELVCGLVEEESYFCDRGREWWSTYGCSRPRVRIRPQTVIQFIWFEFCMSDSCALGNALVCSLILETLIFMPLHRNMSSGRWFIVYVSVNVEAETVLVCRVTMAFC